MTPGLENTIVDQTAYAENVDQLHNANVVLPRISDLADPPARLAQKMNDIADADPDVADARNLFRVHWHNGADRRTMVDVPDHIVLPEALTGVKAKIVVALGNRFPMINTHKVLAAYGCLIPRLMSGSFRPRGVAINRKLLPGRGGDCVVIGLSVGGCVARGHEQRTL